MTTGVLTENGEVKAIGAQKICEFLKKINGDMRRDDIMPSEDELVLDVPLIALTNEEFDDYSFELLDTPGPNEAGADILRKKVNELLDGVDVIRVVPK